ncbi:PadR family transcriptional regulator, partial [Pseudomonas sp. SIMBA_065]
EIERVRDLLNHTAKAIASGPAEPVWETPHE